MNRVPLLLKLFLLYACANQQPESQQAVVSAPRPASQVSPEDTLSVDLAESTVLWKGTKVRGAGKHEGKVRIKEGYLLTDSGGLTGGSFTIDMQSIAVTDIPAHEPVPRKRLVDSRVFTETLFWKERFGKNHTVKNRHNHTIRIPGTF